MHYKMRKGAYRETGGWMFLITKIEPRNLMNKRIRTESIFNDNKTRRG